MSKKSNSNKENIFSFAARQATSGPYFMASALETFKIHEKLDQSALAAYLSISLVELERLSLCARPDVNVPATFATQLKIITEQFGINPGKLANLLRRVAAYQSETTGTSSMLAARDYNDLSSDLTNSKEPAQEDADE